MTISEFTDWYGRHLSAFSNIANWVADLPEEEQRGGRPSQQGVINTWSRVLADVTLEEARRGTDAMARGDLPEPRVNSQHAREIRQWALKQRKESAEAYPYPAQYLHGEQVYRCGCCQDRGCLSIYSEDDLLGVYGGWIVPRGQQGRQVANRAGARPRYTWITTISARCSCQAAQDNPVARRIGLRYDPKRMLAVDNWSHDSRIDAIRAWLAENPAIAEILERRVSA